MGHVTRCCSYCRQILLFLLLRRLARSSWTPRWSNNSVKALLWYTPAITQVRDRYRLWPFPDHETSTVAAAGPAKITTKQEEPPRKIDSFRVRRRPRHLRTLSPSPETKSPKRRGGQIVEPRFGRCPGGTDSGEDGRLFLAHGGLRRSGAGFVLGTPPAVLRVDPDLGGSGVGSFPWRFAAGRRERQRSWEP